MSQSLFPQPPFCELDSLPQPSTKSRLDVSCSFLLLHWGDVGQPLLRTTARPSHQAANIPTLLKTWALQNPHIPQPLLSPVFQSSRAHGNTVGTSYLPAVLQAASKGLGHSDSSCTSSPTKSLLKL